MYVVDSVVVPASRQLQQQPRSRTETAAAAPASKQPASARARARALPARRHNDDEEKVLHAYK